jgi:hypothetical protein
MRHTQHQNTFQTVSTTRAPRALAPIAVINAIRRLNSRKRTPRKSIPANVRVVSFMVLMLLLSMVAAWGQVSVLTQHNNNSRTGANLNETILNTHNVNVYQFGKLFSRFVNGQVYAQPLYVPSVNIGQGLHNVVYIATMKNNIYAFDADDPTTATPLWQVNLGPPVPVADTRELLDINEVVGITSTPVIDIAAGTLYCVAKTKEGGSYLQRLHALDIASGQEKLGGPVVIDGSVPGTGDGSVTGNIRFDPLKHLNRPGLLLLNGYIYMAFGSHGDQRPFHGWVFSYDAVTLQRIAIFNVTPTGWGGAIWQSGQGLAADDNGYIYFMTANGTFNLNTGGRDCSSCFIKLSTPFLNLVDWFAPYNQNELNTNNFELNSSGPLLLPETNLVVGGGKEGILYVVDRSNMGHFQAGSNSQIVQNLQMTYGDHLHGSPIYWESPEGPLVFFWYEEDHLKAFNLINGLFRDITSPTTGLLEPIAMSTMAVPHGMPGGFLSLSANGSVADTGIVWASHSFSGDAHDLTVPGILRAFDASDVSIELWNSRQNAARDDVGNFAKFAPPTIANGKVYLATFSNQLAVYGLLSTSPTPTVSSVAPTAGPAMGGTAVTITGTNFVANATVSMGGSAATNVSVLNSTTITATTPSHAAGAVSVTVTNPDGQSGTRSSGFTYTSSLPAPTVSSVAPTSGPTTGGTAVTLTGTNFVANATVSVGGSAATNVSVVNSTTITATTPAHAAGAVSVTVTNPDGQSGTRSSGFTYTSTSPGISFVQVASATPQSPTQTVPVTYPGPQTVGDLNIVVVGWNDTTATVQSVQDTAGNVYSLAIGPTSGTGLRQSIYYAKNILGGNNTVTVTFTQPATYPDIRILEYKGVSTLDVTAGASGTGSTSSSGSATTTAANELIFGANTVSTDTRGPGSGFTSRIITPIDSDIAEDKIVTTTGTYSATAPLGKTGNWVMQMATFK